MQQRTRKETSNSYQKDSTETEAKKTVKPESTLKRIVNSFMSAVRSLRQSAKKQDSELPQHHKRTSSVLLDAYQKGLLPLDESLMNYLGKFESPISTPNPTPPATPKPHVKKSFFAEEKAPSLLVSPSPVELKQSVVKSGSKTPRISTFSGVASKELIQAGKPARRRRSI